MTIGRDADEDAGLNSVDLVLNLIEFLASSKRARPMTEIARELQISKSRAHRHLRALVQRGYVLQDPQTEQYEISVRLLALGETVRDRFDILPAIRPVVSRLRDETGQTVTVSALVEDSVVALELLHGRTVVEFGVRPGSTLELHASAHGLVALAFGPSYLAAEVLARPLKSWTPATITDAGKLRKQIDKVRTRRWSTAADQLVVGVNALAVPIFDYRGEWRATIAIVGATQFIAAIPSNEQLAQVAAAAAEASRRLGWSVP